MTNPPAVAEVLADYEVLVEVGVGRRTAVAAALADRGRAVTATDVVERDVPDGVRFVVDDVTDPNPAVYEDADAVYALRCPPELQRALVSVTERAGADCLFTTLGGDPVVVPADPETVASGTLFAARTRN
ncbi:UPF0146 family protein [Halobacterium jilantaiense]|uniref:UPF0146 protein SAMN04487945_1594 n=1 Tax=Halobacterium jilantaiense TaxID=355548 RepID=A0A1I0PCL1_9EURY|nr:UPF0146 family protein [Halobacterium jilantaiense]SEW12144.1 hypothetical protein SAMN04487945_1594 [Halobacterium jilantaiense]